MASVLLADDDAAMRDIIERTLASAGHDVTAVGSGIDAVEAMQAAAPRFEVLVTDVEMPGVDGLDLARRALTFDPALKIVVMSGFVDQLVRATEIGSPRVATISKPFTLEQFRVVLSKLMG